MGPNGWRGYIWVSPISPGEAWYWLEPGIFLLPGHLYFDKTAAGQALLKQFLLRADLVKKKCSGTFQNAPVSQKQGRGGALQYSLQELVQIQKVKLTNMWVPSREWGPLEVLFLRCVHSELPVICQWQFIFSYPGTGPQGGFCSRVLLQWVVILCICP